MLNLSLLLKESTFNVKHRTCMELHTFCKCPPAQTPKARHVEPSAPLSIVESPSSAMCVFDRRPPLRFPMAKTPQWQTAWPKCHFGQLQFLRKATDSVNECELSIFFMAKTCKAMQSRIKHVWIPLGWLRTFEVGATFCATVLPQWAPVLRVSGLHRPNYGAHIAGNQHQCRSLMGEKLEARERSEIMIFVQKSIEKL